MNAVTINQIFSIFSAQNPTPQTELCYNNNFTLAVAVILSAQATDKQVNKATTALFAKIDTPEKMLKLGEEGLKERIKSIGLFNSKARNILAMSQILVEKFNSQIPDQLELLEQLPGIGRKTANVILNCAFGHHTIAVDTHVFRVSNRIGLVKTQTPRETEKALKKVIPKEWQQHAHHWLILHGRYTCLARKPKCESCSINLFCKYYNLESNRSE
jgi:endonuclease-3